MKRALILLTALVAGPAAAQPGIPPDDPDSWRVAGTAKVLCSALFVSGRQFDEARAHVADYFLREKLDSITGIRVDSTRRLVRVTVSNRISREAKQYGDQGCVIHQPGRDSVFFTPVRVTSRLPGAATTPWPMGDLLPDTPLPADLDTARLRAATDIVFDNPASLTAGFVVVHRGRIIAERYANGAHRDMQLESWSMGKSITGTLIGLLVHQSAFRLDDPAPIPEWRRPGDPRAAIRVRDLLQMSSGLRFSRGSPEDRPGYHDHDLIYTGAIDAFEFSVTRELQFQPGTRGRYRNADVMALGQLIRDAVRRKGEEYLTWPQRALFDKIGIRRQVLETDPYGNFLLSGYDYGTPRNWARLGMLYLNDGVWNGERLLPEGWTRFVSTPAPGWADSAYGGMVWVNARGGWPLPRDAFAFRGAGGQDTYVVPSLGLVVVRMGHFPGSRVGIHELHRALPLIVEALPRAPEESKLEGTFQWLTMDGKTPPVEFIPGSGLRLTNGSLELSGATGRFVLSFTTRGPGDSVQTSGEKGGFVARGDTLSFTPDGREAQPPVVFRYAWKSDGRLSLTDSRGHVWDYRRR
jgi:CubicO group peptidase (beta-lactamase class C family)